MKVDFSPIFSCQYNNHHLHAYVYRSNAHYVIYKKNIFNNLNIDFIIIIINKKSPVI